MTEYRPDRVMQNSKKETIVVDFKFGRQKIEHHDQVRKYISLLRSMGNHKVTGYLWYVYPNKIIDIVEQSPIAGSPSVDALFYVTYDKVAGIFSTHGFFEQHFKVLPLYCTGILKLVNHYMVELSANLFKDEWRITILYQWIEQGLSIAQKETVCLSVHLPDFFIYASQKAELIKVLYGQVGTFKDSCEAWTIIFCKQQNRVEHRFYIIEDISTIFYIRFLK